MEKLPPELLFKIMLYLPPMERLSYSLTCRRWAEAITSSELLHDVWLDISAKEMEAATSVLVNSQRQYTKLLLHEVDLSKFDSEFWGKIGPHLRVLKLEGCTLTCHVFYAILRQCTKLESFKLLDGLDDFVPPSGACQEELRESLSLLRHLHLDIKLNADILDFLLGLMPNVTSLFLSSFDQMTDFLERLPSVLKKTRIIRTGADFHGMAQVECEEIITLVEIMSGSLEELRIYGAELTEYAYDAIVNCNKLRRLTVEEPGTSFDAVHLRKLLSNSPDLEILELFDINYLEDEVMVLLSQFKKLRTLSLTGPSASGIPKEENLCRLQGISTLVKLDLTVFDVDSRVIRSLGCLTNLRTLLLRACVDSECLEAICENFDKLTELDFGNVNNLTDTDGVKFCRFKELRSLSFSYGHKFTDVTFKRGVGSRAMKSLIMDGCSLTDAGLASIASHHDRLEKLSLEYCENITDAGVVVLLQNERRLKDLSIKHCELLQFEWDTVLSTLCPRLRIEDFSL